MLPLVAQERPKWIRWRISSSDTNNGKFESFRAFSWRHETDTVKSSGNAAFYISQNYREEVRKGHEERLEKGIRNHGRKNPVRKPR